VGETRGPDENHLPAANQTLSHNVVTSKVREIILENIEEEMFKM
jgi:hypothetical protein